MPPHITINRASPCDGQDRVCHFDELSDSAKDDLAEAVRNEIPAEVNPETASELVQYDLIKFVEYYNVQLAEASVNSAT